MDSKTLKAIAGLALAPLAYEVVPHHRDDTCIDLNLPVACDAGEQYFIVPHGVHVPHAEFDTSTGRLPSIIASGVASTSSSGMFAVARMARWLADRNDA